MRHVILEGPDGAGKTTLAQKLIKKHGFLYHHEGPPPEGSGSLLHYYAERLLDAKEPTVFDRFHLGEMVYGPLLRGASRISGEEAVLMNRLIAGTGTVVLGCLPPFGVCLRNNRAKEEMIKDERVLAEAYKQWLSILHYGAGLLLVNGHIYDYESQEYFLQATEACDDAVIGSPHAKFLFVGEKPNGALDLPFFTAERSSQYLNHRLAAAGFAERDCAFTNAHHPDGMSRNLAKAVLGFHRPIVVVALGKAAEEAVKDQRLKHISRVTSVQQLPHPSFWKRFHATEETKYEAMLQEIYAAS